MRVITIFTEWERALAACRLFAGIDSEELEIMLECLNPAVRSYKKNEYLAVQGDDLHGLGVLLEGEVMVVKENAAGERVIMAVLGAGDIFGGNAAVSGARELPASGLAHVDWQADVLPPQQHPGNYQM